MARTQIMVKILADSHQIEQKLNALQSKLEQTFGGKAVAAAKYGAGTFAALAGALGAAGAASVKAAADMERTETAFKNMLGSAEKAGAFIKDLQDFAAHTPFEFNQVSRAAQKFLAFGFTAEQVIPTLTAVGDAAAALGMGQDGIDRLTLALGQMAAKGKVSGEEMRQLAEAGIPAWQMLADKIGVSIPEAMGMAEKGAIDAGTALEALTQGMNDKFAGMMTAQSQTVWGLLSTLQDNVNQTMIAIGNDIIAAFDLKGILQEVGEFTDQFRAAVQQAGIADAIRKCIPPEVGIAATALTGALVAVAAVGFAAVAAAAASALAALAPFIAIGAAVGAAVYLIWKNFNLLKQGFAEIVSLMPGLQSAFGAFQNALRSVGNLALKAFTACKPLLKLLGAALVVAAGAAGAAFLLLLNGLSAFAAGVMNAFSAVVNASAWLWEQVGNVLDWLGDVFTNLSDAILPAWANNGLRAIGDFVGTAIDWLDSLLQKVQDVAAALGFTASVAAEKSGSGGGGWTAPKPTMYRQFSGMNEGKAVGGGSHGGSGGKSDFEKLQDDARAVSKAIEEAWAQTFKTRSEMVDRWYAEETAELEKSRAANENYERDKQRLIELYAQKRLDALAEEAKRARELQASVRDIWRDFADATQVKPLTGADRLFADLTSAQQRATDEVHDRWAKLSESYITMTAQEQAVFRQALNERGILYSLDAENRIDFGQMAATELAAIDADYYRQRVELLLNNRDIEAEIKAAYDTLDLERLQEFLSAENVIRLEDYEIKKAQLDEYLQAEKDAHFSAAEAVMEIRRAGFDSLQQSISGLLQGTMSWRDALLNVGKALNKVISDYIANWITGLIKKATIEKSQKAAQVATEQAAGATVAAAWYPAAMNVLIATQGTAAATAMSAYSAAMSAGAGMSAAAGGLSFGGALGAGLPKLAAGGLATSATLAEIGEGIHDEAVVPLNDEVYGRIGAGIAENGGTRAGGDIHIHAFEPQSFLEFLAHSPAGAAMKQFLFDEGRDFATEGGVW